jgi:hypothetical protein
MSGAEFRHSFKVFFVEHTKHVITALTVLTLAYNFGDAMGADRVMPVIRYTFEQRMNNQEISNLSLELRVINQMVISLRQQKLEAQRAGLDNFVIDLEEEIDALRQDQQLIKQRLQELEVRIR